MKDGFFAVGGFAFVRDSCFLSLCIIIIGFFYWYLAVWWVIDDIEPKGDRLTQPTTGIGNKQTVEAKQVKGGRQLGKDSEPRPGIHNPHEDCTDAIAWLATQVVGEEFFLDFSVCFEEGKGGLCAVEEGTVGVSVDVAVFVVAPVLGGPPDGPSLVGEAAEQYEEGVGDGPGLEGGVGGVAVQADGHADVDLGDGDEEGGEEGQVDARRGGVVAEGGEGEQQGGHEGGHHHHAVDGLAAGQGRRVAHRQQRQEGLQLLRGQLAREHDHGERDVDCDAHHVHLHAARPVPRQLLRRCDGRCCCRCGGR